MFKMFVHNLNSPNKLFQKKYWTLISILIFLIFPSNGKSFEALKVSSETDLYKWGKYAYYFEDPSRSLTAQEVSRISPSKFKRLKKNDYSFMVSQSMFWIRINIHADKAHSKLMGLGNAFVDEVSLYKEINSEIIKISSVGAKYPFNHREVKTNALTAKLNLDEGPNLYFLRINSNYLISLGVTSLAKESTFYYGSDKLNFNNIIYLGFVFCMILFNIFFYFHSQRDKNYLYYLAYLIPFWFYWLSSLGFGFKFFWPESPKFNINLITVLSGLWAVGLLVFTAKFLKLKELAPKWNFTNNSFLAFYSIGTLIFLLNSLMDFELLDLVNKSFLEAGFIVFNFYCPFALLAALNVYKKGYRPARFYLLAFSIFLLVTFALVLTAFNLIPIENIEVFKLFLIGSGLEVLLINLALFDKQKIERNRYKKEIQKTNEKLDLINRELEKRVNERTSELKSEMESHIKAKKELQKAQSSLVQAEKMSSLGELVAGVAHEINNPVNFVQNNHQCTKDAVDEIHEKLKAIIPNEGDGKRVWDLLDEPFKTASESSKNHLIGTKRITKIVKSLLAFSRHDQAEFKSANLNELIEETLVIINNQAKKISIEMEFGEIKDIECNGSQLSQVFMNLLTNAIYASNKGSEEPRVKIKTWQKDDKVNIEISDNGKGIDPNIKDTLFDPFVTTKPVGEGTGMGLAICYNIVNEHNGHISISDCKPGACFKITIPLQQKNTTESGANT